MQVYVPKLTSTTCPRRSAGVNGSELIQAVGEVVAMTRHGRSRSAQGSERDAQLFGEQLWLFPGGEVAASVEPVVVDEVVRVGTLGPAARRLVQLVGEHADGEGDRDRLGVEEVRLA